VVTKPPSNQVRSRARSLRRIDPVLATAMLVLAGVGIWIAAPMASGASTANDQQRIEVDVPVATSVTPGWTTGDASVRMPNLSIPGQPRDVTSPGWKMSTNWTNGYEVRVRSTTAPALRGRNATDGAGAQDAFADYSTDAACPCAWTAPRGANKGLFGYSVSVATTSGLPVQDATQWGSQAARKWRGLDTDSYRAYSTRGGAGQYTMALHFRSMIPDGAIQREGSYRASVVLSAHPLL